MAPSVCHLPNGQNLIVTPVFGGVSFKVNELSNHRSVFPPGWIVILNEEDGDDETEGEETPPSTQTDPTAHATKKHVHRYTKPTLHNDHLFVSSTSAPNNAEFKPPSSPTRQIAMMLWATLWWYFHQPEPDHTLHNHASDKTPEEGRPRGSWKINIRREGIFKGKNVLAKLERMGLITSEDSSVGTSIDDRTGSGWGKMFVTRKAFWQMDARIYLFTQSPVAGSPFPPGSPFSSRPGSPSRLNKGGSNSPVLDAFDERSHAGGAVTPMLAGPFQSNSHLPTYYPPHPAHYVFTNSIRHPLRPKPYRQGETIYVRYIPSLGQYLSFRVASLSRTAPSSQGPWSNAIAQANITANRESRQSISESIIPTISSLNIAPNDIELLHRWMNDPRVAHGWGCDGAESVQEDYLRQALKSRHSFPVIGCFDGKPFGFFEIYWVKEDILGKYLGGDVGDYDRGLHVLVGEQKFRGAHRVKVWLSALVHYCWLADMRTESVMLEPRIDNVKLKDYCVDVGFFKERELTFPHKQSNLLKIRRDAWESPAI